MKYVTMKRSLSLLMALIMVLGTLFMAVSCGTGEDDPSKDTGNQTTGEAETDKPLAYDTVEKQKFDREFNLMTRDDIAEDFEIEDLTGDLLDDMLYERNAKVATDFEIEFSYYKLPYAEVNTTLNTQATSGTDDYDMYVGHKYSYGTCAQNNYCYNLGEIGAMDLTQPWWDQNCYANMTVNGRTYMITGDIFPSSMLTSSCLVFNRKMVKELGKSDTALFEMARNGGWTMDAMYDYCKDVSFDLNGDGNMSYTDDRYCLTSWMMDVPFSMYYACNESFVTIVDGTPELTYSTEKVINIYEKIYKIIVEQNSYFVTDLNQYATTYEPFVGGRAMFCDVTLSKITTFISEMDDPYGILPMPKYDEHQPEYLSFVNGATPFVMVAKTVEDPEFVGTILEAMATYNYDKVTPKLFEVATKLQAAQDPTSAAMVDYIVRNRIWDLGYFADWAITNQVRLNLEAKKSEIAGDLKKQDSAAKRGLNLLLKNYEKHQ
jgi:ABC-type glycerol-3-phosphate transport system substrate-binding protein